MPHRPNIGGKRVDLVLGKFDASHRRHGTGKGFRFRDAVRDRLGDRWQAAVAPDPCAGCEIRPDRCALGVRTVAPGAGGAADVAVENAITECDLFLRRAGRHGKGRPRNARLGMDTFRRQRLR